MTKLWSHFTYIILFFLLTITAYGTFTGVDYSFDYFTIIRVLLIGICYFYFYKLTGHIYTLLKVSKKHETLIVFRKSGWTFVAAILCILHLILVSITTDSLNNYLIKSDNKQAIATIKDCYVSKSTEYCVYSYSVDNKSYELKYCNEPDNLKFKERDTAIVIYYTKLPVISLLKREFDLHD
jgi:hypothetical protein